MTKTNVMRLLDAAKIPYRAAEYAFDENDLNGMHAAEGIGMPPEQIFKTLVARGERSGFVVFCIPVCCELDLKKAAKAAGDKKIELASKSAKLLLDGGANKIELTASQISINGKQMAELKGQSLKLEGTSVELKAKGTMKAEASGVAQLKGAMVKIN